MTVTPVVRRIAISMRRLPTIRMDQSFFRIHEPASNDNLIALFHFFHHRLNELRAVLPVAIKLNGILIALMVSVFHARLKAARKPQVYRKIQQVEACSRQMTAVRSLEPSLTTI